MAAPRSLEPRDKPGTFGELLPVLSLPTALVLDDDHLPLLLSFAKRASAKWRKIGVSLKFEDAVFNEIETSISNGEAVACFTELLTRWLKRAPPKHSLPTLEAMLEALREDAVGEERIAYNLEQDFTSNIHTNLLFRSKRRLFVLLFRETISNSCPWLLATSASTSHR